MKRTSSICLALSCMGVSAPGLWAQVATTRPTTQPWATSPVYVVPEMQSPYRRVPYVVYPQWPTTDVPSNEVAQRYSCVIRIDTEATNSNGGFAGSINDPQSAAALLTSTALIDPAVKSTLHIMPQHRQDSAVVNVYPVGQRLARVEVILRDIPGQTYSEDAAAKLTNALVERLKAAYAESSAAARQAAAGREAPLQKQIESIKARIEELRTKQHEVRGKASNSHMVYNGGDPSFELNNLRSQKKSAESELARNRARLETLDPSSGPLAAQWNDVVNLRQKQVNELQKAVDEKKAQPADLQEAEAKLADAKTQLAQLRQSRQPDGTNNGFRANEVASLRSNIVEEEDRLKDLSAQIAKLDDPKYLELLDQLPDMQNEQNRLQSQLFELQNRLDQLRHSEEDAGSVTVTVLDGQRAKD